jgi:transposase
MTIVEVARPVVGGVDTHLDVHVAAAVDSLGGLLGVRSFPTTPAGYHALSAWLGSFGTIERVGVEGTSTYGAGLAAISRPPASPSLRSIDRTAKNVDATESPTSSTRSRPHAQVLSGRAHGFAKGGDGNVEALRALLVAKRSARSIRIKTTGQLRHLVVTAPDDLRTQLAALTTQTLASKAAALRPRASNDSAAYATKTAIVTLALRVQAINSEIAAIDRHLTTFVCATAPTLLEIYGVGVDTAPILLVAAGDNARRIRSEAAWAHLREVAPIPAGSGKTNKRRRFNPGGNRQANHALWRIVVTRLGQRDPRTLAYMQRRLAEGRTKPEIIRSLKCYVARDLPTALRVTLAVTGLAPDCPDTPLSFERPAVPTPETRRTAWPHKSAPPSPITGLPATT